MHIRLSIRVSSTVRLAWACPVVPTGWVSAGGAGYPAGMLKRALWQGLVAGAADGVMLTLGGEKSSRLSLVSLTPMGPRRSCSG
ncbi:hypothetical protein [Streptomyces sp. NBC_00299]|uniref:hypothetical protein n=1 Tax=Streptomyces sp. NBC_00299 TaxID=2975705 RepID=UPI002E2B03BF|nr:hypothetical protein [Streptomyces sp. NBC_00299]